MDLQLFADSSQERTEEPTPRRLREAREKGQVAKSAELASGIAMVAAAMTLRNLGGGVYARLLAETASGFRDAFHQEMTMDQAITVFQQVSYTFVLTVAPVILTLMGVGILQGVAQTRLMFSGSMLKPRFDRLNPLTGIGKILSKQTATELIKNLAKITMFGYVAYVNLKSKIPAIPNLLEQSLPGAASYMADAATGMLLQVGLAMLALGALDYGYQWWTVRQQLMMTKQEVKEEMKQQEGSPEVKQKVRQRQREMAQRRKALKNVPQATVVITNPTHFAIAIRFQMGVDPAPIVVAKGMDILAQRIKVIAKQHDVPMIENRPLARALYKIAEIGDPVPEELYLAVAEVLAFVFRLKREIRQ